ncbi:MULTISPECIES: LysE family translocator [Bacillaceae]|uniref:Amino acid transporter n=2 Tax=Bacillaceae TaxID=186817 RepID=A0A9D5HX97_9BACI|nr:MULTISPECIES: LysE family transporter [Bacillaceae]KQL56511.1 amino acid transporter [Alkalicoccobacillus plakortidis]MBG9784946.1 amino acid transporter [Shouchella lehensis]TES46365.1 amino acid transporter [Shouchella lehensis]
MVLSIVFSYLLLGISLGAPIGPVNAARIEKGIQNGFMHSWMVGIGSLFADATFMACVYFGLQRFIDAPFIQSFLWLFGAFVLFYSGIEGMMRSNRFSIIENRHRDTLIHCFFNGFLISISNPMSIMFWLGIYGSIMVKTAETATNQQLLLYTCMIFIGLTMWDLFVASMTSGGRRFLRPATLKAIALLSGLSLVAFGVYFAIHGIQLFV